MSCTKRPANFFSAALLVCLISATGLFLSPTLARGQTSPPAIETAQPSEQSLRAAVRETEEKYGPDSKELLKPLYGLANYLTKNERYKDALEVLDHVLPIEVRVYGPEHPEVAGTFEWMANVSRYMGQYAKAERLYQRSLEIREKVLGPEDPDVATTLNRLATVYERQKQYAKAEPLYQRSLEIREKILGPEHPDVASSLDDLAFLYRMQDQYAKAEPLYQRSLAIQEKALGPEHLDVATTLNRLATVYERQKQYAKAEPLYQRSLEIREKILGPEHPDVASSLDDLAFLYRMQDQYAKAEPLYQRSLAIQEKALGPEHLDVATTLNRLATVYERQKQYAKAEPLYQRSLEIREKILGPEHPDVASSLDYLAFLYRMQDQYAKAEPLYQRSLAIQEKALGPEHLDVATTLNRLATVYERQKQYAKAEPLYQRSLEIRERVLGPEHADVATSLNNFAGFYQTRGQYAKAESFLLRALAIDEKAHGPDDPAVATHLNNLAVLYSEQGEFGKDEPLYLRALAIREKALGPDHPDVANSLNHLAGLYATQGNYAKAEPLVQRSLAVIEKALGSEHPSVAQSLDYLATIYGLQGQYAKAEPLFQKSLAIRAKSLGLDHPDVAGSLIGVANLYLKQRQYGKAEPLFQRSLALLEKALGFEHPSVATSLNGLGVVYCQQGQYVKAVPLFERSREILENAFGPEHPSVARLLNNLALLYESLHEYNKVLPLQMRALQIASATNVPEFLWEIQYGLRISLAREGKTDLATFFGKQAVNTIQSLRGNLSGKDREAQRAFLQDKSGVYRGLADLLIDQGRLPEAQQVLAMLKEEELYDFLTRSATEDNRKTTSSYNGIEENWHKRYQEISNKLGNISSELEELDKKAKLGVSEEETKRRDQLRSDRRVAQQAFDKFLGDLMRELETASAKRNREVGERNLANLRALQSTLGSLGHGAVTLHYVMGENKLRMILTTPTIQIARESEISSKELNRKIQEFHTLLSDPKSNPLPLAQELYKHLIAPVSEDLRQAKAQTLMVSLDGAMRYIPLAALYNGEKYLIEDYRISIYTEAAKDKLKDDPKKQWSVAGLGLTHKIEGFSALPAVRQEIEGIVKVGDKGVLPGEAHFDTEFNAKQFRHALDKSYPVLHIASHFVFRPGNESNSFLLLGDGTRLSLTDLNEDDYRFRDVDLLTLSACETAVGGGADANGLEIEGFGALAQKQGAKGVIATLWRVADKSTGILMQNFYRLHEQTTGITKIGALREAMLAFIHGGNTAVADLTERGAARGNVGTSQETWKPDPAKPYAHPYYWAPFILMGNWK